MKNNYICIDCQHAFAIEITDLESRTRLAADRTDACPQCGQRVGTGHVHCRNCASPFVLAFPHWHVQCDVAHGHCPACGALYQSLCVC